MHKPTLLGLKETLAKTLFRPVSTRRLGPKLQEYLLREPIAGQAVPPYAPGVISKAGTGRNAIVRFWEHPVLGALFARAWRYDFRIRPAREHRHAGGLFREAGLRVPELLLLDDSFRTMRRYRLELVIERAAPGQSAEMIRPLPPELLQTWAGELVRLHSQRSLRWGKPWCPVNEAEDPKAFWTGRLAKFRHRIPGNVAILTDKQVRDGLHETEGRLRAFQFERPALVHGDINPDNLFVDPQAGITWIDFGTVHYGLAAEDLVCIYKWLEPLGLFEEFSKHYEAAGGAPQASWQPGFDLMERLMAFEKLSSRIVKTTHRAHITGKKRARLLDEQEFYERRIGDLLGASSTSD